MCCLLVENVYSVYCRSDSKLYFDGVVDSRLVLVIKI